MNKSTFPVLLFLFSITLVCHAQNPTLYGMTFHGGKGGAGSIFKTDGTGAAFQSEYSFTSQAAAPMGNVIQAFNGLLYGMTSTGGVYGAGIIFSYDTATGVYTDLYDFGNGIDGHAPFGSLFQASDSLLYGTTSAGGNSTTVTGGCGVIFSYNIATGKETVLYNFVGGSGDGETPCGSLIEVGDSVLYGLTKFGGSFVLGTIFSYNIITGKEDVVHNFASTKVVDGNSPLGSLLLATNGLLYGLAQDGGAHDAGMMFSFNAATDSETDIHDFTGADGGNPLGSLMQANNGLLYGMTSAGAANESGTIFSYDITKDTLITLHSFGAGKDGAIPNGSLIQANDSLLYGMTQFGGTDNSGQNGVIFSYNITKDTEIVIHNFKATDGKQPLGSLLQASNGLLYGMTPEGGSLNAGVLLRYNIAADTEMVIHTFGIDTDGNYPNGSLIKATNGLLYGLTENGGANNLGSIFSYDVTMGAEKDLYDFGSGTDGQSPFGALLQVSDSLFYGMTSGGGTNNDGIIFKYNSLTGKETDVHNFAGDTDGLAPYGSLILAKDGLLYGLTTSNLFSFNITTNKLTDLHDFGNGNDGAYPYSSPMQASDSLIYGTTLLGGTENNGTIFSYNIATGTETVLYNFKGVLSKDGSAPYCTLLQASNGILYGTTYGGGNQDLGTMFSYNITTGTEKQIVSLDGTDGQNPSGSFIQANNGMLYATTSYGGTDNDGSIISYDISTSTETNIHSFTGVDGDNPNGSLLDIDTPTGIAPITLIKQQLIIYPNPTSGQFNISLNNYRNGYTLAVYNIMGEKVYQMVTSNSQNIVNLSSQPSGLYFVYLKSDEGIGVGKVIISR